MSCQLHLGKIPLPNGLEEAVIANMRMLLRGGERVATSWKAVSTCRLCRGDWGFNKAVHRWMLQKSQTSGHQQHPNSLTGTLIYIPHKYCKSLTLHKDPHLWLHWLHTYKTMQQSAAVEVCVCQGRDGYCANRDEPINSASDPTGGSSARHVHVCVWAYISTFTYRHSQK